MRVGVSRASPSVWPAAKGAGASQPRPETSTILRIIE